MSEWIPTRDKLPNDSDFILANIVDDDNQYLYAEVLSYDHDVKVWRYHSGKTLDDKLKVTAWMPIRSVWVSR